jgi:hypothetical protein
MKTRIRKFLAGLLVGMLVFALGVSAAFLFNGSGTGSLSVRGEAHVVITSASVVSQTNAVCTSSSSSGTAWVFDMSDAVDGATCTLRVVFANTGSNTAYADVPTYTATSGGFITGWTAFSIPAGSSYQMDYLLTPNNVPVGGSSNIAISVHMDDTPQ